VKNRR